MMLSPCEQRVTKPDWNLDIHGAVQIDSTVQERIFCYSGKKRHGIDGQGRRNCAAQCLPFVMNKEKKVKSK